MTLTPITLPSSFNYIAVFLTFSCQLRCTYCINHHGGNLVKDRRMSGEDWIKGLNRLNTRSDLPITIQGGEPSVHKDFLNIIGGVRNDIPIDILTNLEMPLEFWRQIPPKRLQRSSKYASIRVSYHHGQSNFEELTSRVRTLSQEGYHIGIWEVDNPDYHNEVIVRQQQAHSMGIDYRLKEFLGPHGGKTYGTFRYPGAVNDRNIRMCDCRTSELLIAPDGQIFRCHSDLYANRLPIGHILDTNPPNLGAWKSCSVYGKCNSCDIKLKTNRFQEFGHSSVEIENISELIGPNDEYVNTVVNTYGKR